MINRNLLYCTAHKINRPGYCGKNYRTKFCTSEHSITGYRFSQIIQFKNMDAIKIKVQGTVEQLNAR